MIAREVECLFFSGRDHSWVNIKMCSPDFQNVSWTCVVVLNVSQRGPVCGQAYYNRPHMTCVLKADFIYTITIFIFLKKRKIGVPVWIVLFNHVTICILVYGYFNHPLRSELKNLPNTHASLQQWKYRYQLWSQGCPYKGVNTAASAQLTSKVCSLVPECFVFYDKVLCFRGDPVSQSRKIRRVYSVNNMTDKGRRGKWV